MYTVHRIKACHKSNNYFLQSSFHKSLIVHFLTDSMTKVFPHLNGNTPTVSAYEVYISQLIRYTRAFSLYSDVLRRYRLLSTKLFQATDFLKNLLVLSFKTFFGRYEYLVNKFLTCARHDERWCWQLHFGSTLTIIGSLMSCDDLVYYLILK